MSAVGTKYWFRNKWGLQNSTPPICPLAHCEPLYYRAFVWDQKQVCRCSLNRLVVLILQRPNWVLRVLLWDAWRWSRVLVANDASIFLSDRRMLYFNECSGIRSRTRWKMMRSRTFYNLWQNQKPIPAPGCSSTCPRTFQVEANTGLRHGLRLKSRAYKYNWDFVRIFPIQRSSNGNLQSR